MKSNEINIQNLTPYFLQIDYDKGVIMIDLKFAKPPLVITVSPGLASPAEKGKMQDLKKIDIDEILRMNPGLVK